MPPSGIRRFFDIAATMDDVISLGVGEPDFDTPRVIVEAGVESLREGRTHYTSNFGTVELRRALSRHLDGRYGVRYDPATEILVTVGASEAVDLALRATCDPGDEVILHEPSYVAYVPAIVFAGGVARHVATRFEDDFALDPAAVEAAITPRTKALFLGYPCNPTGAVLPDDVQDALAEIAVRHDLLVYSDEIYDRLAYGSYRHRAMSALAGMRDRTILMGGFSKAYAMTGWRVGYVAGPAAILEGMVKVHQYSIMSAPTTAQDAALAAIVEGEADVAADAGRVRPAPPPDRRRAQRPRARDVRAARRVLCLPADRVDRARRRDVRRAAADRGARRGRPGECLRAVGRRATCGCATRPRTSGWRRPSCGSAGSWSGSGSEPSRPGARARLSRRVAPGLPRSPRSPAAAGTGRPEVAVAVVRLRGPEPEPALVGDRGRPARRSTSPPRSGRGRS